MPAQPQNICTSPSLSSITPYDGYYFDDGDLNILVGSRVFRINSVFFKRDSEKFRKEIEAAKEIHDANQRPGSTSCPFQIKEASPDEFAGFLSLFYDTYQDRSKITVDEWTGILKVAHAHEFPKIKEMAILGLEQRPDAELGLANRIMLYRRFDVKKEYIIPHFVTFIRRDAYPSDEEDVTLGVEVSALVSRARQNFLKATGGGNIVTKVTDETAKGCLLAVTGAASLISLAPSMDNGHSTGLSLSGAGNSTAASNRANGTSNGRTDGGRRS